VTAARVAASLQRGSDLVFAQIDADNKPSFALHEDVGFVHVGGRQVFVLVED
jgi:L-amino acid N-acyltransferase YncA